MGNNASVAQSGSTVKVVLPDGTIHKFDKSVTVAELMLEYPQQAVIELSSSTLKKIPSPLPADKKLEVRKIYLMVPIKQRGKAIALSSEEVFRVFSRSNLMPRSTMLVAFVSKFKFLPLLSPICVAGGREGKRGGKLMNGERFEEEEGERLGKVDVLDGLDVVDRQYYCYLSSSSSRQLSGRGWKPSLDTIEENNKTEKKVPHWLFLNIK
ncbi:hypothetical protein Dimus_016758 [Dionaea muscipula]